MAKSACEDQSARTMIGLSDNTYDLKSNGYYRRDVELLSLLQGLCLQSTNERNQALQHFSRITDEWFERYGSPIREYDYAFNDGSECCSVLDRRQKLQLLLPDIVQMSLQCPFEDVRNSLTALLSSFRDRGMKIPKPTFSSPSFFLPLTEVIPVSTDDPERQSVFTQIFLQSYQLDHVTQVMGFHPRYLSAFQAMQQFLLRGDGPLPFDQRHYIAIMAAARHHCSYLVYQQISSYLICDGNPTWLRNLDSAPLKLRNLSELNRLMAHRPWLIRKCHFEKLLRGSESWSLSELMHAIVLLAHFHTLASFVHGCGIAPEVTHLDGHSYSSMGNGHSINGSKMSQDDGPVFSAGIMSSEGGIDVLMERMKKLEKEADLVRMSPDELLTTFHTVESQSAELTAGVQKITPKTDIMCFVEDADFSYQDFAKRGLPSEIPTFRADDYSWEDQGYSLTNKLYQNMGNLLDEKFKIAYSLTYRTLGNKINVDTSAFRRAVWYYIQTLFGIRHDDYDYSAINQLLERNLKAYMKVVTCYPERVTKKDYDSCMFEFKHSEKVHVNVMLMEARLQAEMLYTLRALTQYMT